MYTSGAHARDPRVPIRQSRTGPRTAHSCHCTQRPQQQVHPQVQRGVQRQQQRASRRKLQSCAGSCAHGVRTFWQNCLHPVWCRWDPSPTRLRAEQTSDRSLFYAYVWKLNTPDKSEQIRRKGKTHNKCRISNVHYFTAVILAQQAKSFGFKNIFFEPVSYNVHRTLFKTN